MKKLLAAAGVLAVLSPVTAFAKDIPFGGTVTSTCSIVVPGSSTLTQNADATVLSGSTSVTINATSQNYEASVADPSGWSTAPADAPSTTFAATVDGGVAPVAIAAGGDSVTVAMTATADSGSFTDGAYATVVPLTCS